MLWTVPLLLGLEFERQANEAGRKKKSPQGCGAAALAQKNCISPLRVLDVLGFLPEGCATTGFSVNREAYADGSVQQVPRCVLQHTAEFRHARYPADCGFELFLSKSQN